MTELRGKHLLIVVENLPVPFDRRVWQEATTLREAGCDVTVLCPKGRGFMASHEVMDGIEIFRYPLPTEGNGALGYLLEYGSAIFWWTIYSWWIFFRKRFHAIHACNPPDLIFLAALPFKCFCRVKFVFDHHDLNPELYLAKFNRQDLFYRLMLVFERLTFATADMTIATNNSYRAVAIERGHKSPANVTVVRSGPEIKRLRILPPDDSLRHGKRYLVGYVGVIGKQEGLDLLIDSVRFILYDCNRSDVHFVVIGDGPEAQAIRAYARRQGVDNAITFTGRIPDVDLLPYLNTCDVCVNPDVVNAMNSKSTMNKIMEYMALGKPIVQFEMVEGRYSAGEASLYAAPNDPVDFAQKILCLLDDAQSRERMGAFGRNRVINELQWEYEKPKLIAAYQRLFASGSDKA
jgi:glycosyltransferase involved in cell wall biosynthesis